MAEPTLLNTLQAVNQSASFNRWAGFQVTQAAAGEAELRMDWRKDDMGQYAGHLHAGLIGAMLDTACGYAAGTVAGRVAFFRQLPGAGRGPQLCGTRACGEGRAQAGVCQRGAVCRAGQRGVAAGGYGQCDFGADGGIGGITCFRGLKKHWLLAARIRSTPVPADTHFNSA
jgi:hypothetical protein